MSKYPFADNAADIVISRYSAITGMMLVAALREVNRILKPSGKLIVMDVMSPGRTQCATSGYRR